MDFVIKRSYVLSNCAYDKAKCCVIADFSWVDINCSVCLCLKSDGSKCYNFLKESDKIIKKLSLFDCSF